MATAATAIAMHHQAVAWQPRPLRPCAVASRCAWWHPHITALPCSLLLLVQSVGTACCPAQAPQSCRLVCVAVVVIARCGNTLRFYITPHCIKCMPVSRQAPLVVMHRLRALSGLRSRRYAKLPTLGRSPVVGAPRSLRALRAATCRPLGVPAWWLWSGALRSAFSQRLRRVIGVGPRPPLALACFASIACAVCPSAP